ncbi:MAG: HEAT repeat domain-containing protein [Verrucomicrobia bacterium]|nr:HEAT repeat domain-containing protein [Verrucomicrobiota bacterium]
MKTWLPALESAAFSVAALYLGALAVLLTLAAAAWLLLRRNPQWNAAAHCLVWSAVPAATALWLVLALQPASEPISETASRLGSARLAKAAAAAGLRPTSTPRSDAPIVALPHSNSEEGGVSPIVLLPNAAPAAAGDGWRSLRVAWSLAVVAFAIVWVGGALWRLGRLAADALRLARIKRRSTPLPAELAELAARELRAAAPRRAVEVRRTADLKSPAAAGLGRALILLPQALECELSEEEVAQVLRHELAHLERGDDWMQAATRVVEALLWPLPGLRQVVREAELARESACDEWVLAAAPRPKTYARCLTKIAGLRLETGSSLRLAHGMAVSSKPHLFRRVENILARRGAPASPRLAPGRAALVIVVAVLAVSGFQRAWAALPEVERPSVLSDFITVQNDDSGRSITITVPEDTRELREKAREMARKAREDARRAREQGREAADLGEALEETIREGLTEGLSGLREGVLEGLAEAREGMKGLRFSFSGTDDQPPKKKLNTELVALLARSAAEDADAGVRIESIQTLSKAEGKEVTDALLRALDAAKDDAVREAAVLALGRRQKDNPQVASRLVEIAKSSTVGSAVRDAAFRSLSRSGGDDSIRALGQIYDGAPAPVKESVIRALGRVAQKSKIAAEKLSAIAREDADPKMRRRAIQQLSRGLEEEFEVAWPPRPPKAPKAPAATPGIPAPPAAPAAPAAPSGTASCDQLANPAPLAAPKPMPVSNLRVEQRVRGL